MTWQETRVKHVAEIINGHPFDAATFADTGDMPLVRIRDILSDTFATFVESSLVPGSAVIQNGDIVIGMDGDFNSVRWSRGPAALNQRLCTLRLRSDVDAQFMAYALPASLKAINDLTYATTVKHLSSGQVGDIRLRFPPLDEQRAIADYLDRETAQIDTLIAKQQQLIATLRERRGAVLDALTAAIRAPRIPLRHAAERITVGIVVQPSQWYANSGVPALRGTNVKPEELDLDDLVYLSAEGHHAHAKSELHPGDVVVVRTGKSGTAAVVPSTLGIANAIDLLIVQPGTALSGEYLAAMLNAPAARELASQEVVGTIQGHFNVSALRSVEVPLPPLEEQLRIVRAWRAQARKIDALIVKAGQFIEVSKERRAALITAAVTGELAVPAS